MWGCAADNVRQKWSTLDWVELLLVNANGDDACLSALSVVNETNANPAVGAQKCQQASYAQQRWSYDPASGEVRNADGYCIDAGQPAVATTATTAAPPTTTATTLPCAGCQCWQTLQSQTYAEDCWRGREVCKAGSVCNAIALQVSETCTDTATRTSFWKEYNPNNIRCPIPGAAAPPTTTAAPPTTAATTLPCAGCQCWITLQQQTYAEDCHREREVCTAGSVCNAIALQVFLKCKDPTTLNTFINIFHPNRIQCRIPGTGGRKRRALDMAGKNDFASVDGGGGNTATETTVKKDVLGTTAKVNSQLWVCTLNGGCEGAAASKQSLLGTNVVVRKCDQQANQRWTYTESIGRLKNHGGLCLNAGTAGAGAYMWGCDESSPNQHWGLSSKLPDAAEKSTCSLDRDAPLSNLSLVQYRVDGCNITKASEHDVAVGRGGDGEWSFESVFGEHSAMAMLTHKTVGQGHNRMIGRYRADGSIHWLSDQFTRFGPSTKSLVRPLQGDRLLWASQDQECAITDLDGVVVGAGACAAHPGRQRREDAAASRATSNAKLSLSPALGTDAGQAGMHAGISDFSSRTGMETAGWVFSSKARTMHRAESPTNYAYCDKANLKSYCGYDSAGIQNPRGTISLALTTKAPAGFVTLNFGSANSGNVHVLINGKTVYTATGSDVSLKYSADKCTTTPYKYNCVRPIVKTFPFNRGDTLALQEDGVMVLNSISISGPTTTPKAATTTKATTTMTNQQTGCPSGSAVPFLTSQHSLAAPAPVSALPENPADWRWPEPEFSQVALVSDVFVYNPVVGAFYVHQAAVAGTHCTDDTNGLSHRVCTPAQIAAMWWNPKRARMEGWVEIPSSALPARTPDGSPSRERRAPEAMYAKLPGDGTCRDANGGIFASYFAMLGSGLGEAGSQDCAERCTQTPACTGYYYGSERGACHLVGPALSCQTVDREEWSCNRGTGGSGAVALASHAHTNNRSRRPWHCVVRVQHLSVAADLYGRRLRTC